MKLVRTFRILASITSLALIYTHMQMQIFDMAYRGKQKELEIADLSGNNGLVAYDIMQLKSAHHLGATVLSGDSGLRFRDQGNIVRLVSTELAPAKAPVIAPRETRANALLSLLTLRSEAEARTTPRRR